MRYDLLMKNCMIPDGDTTVAAEIAVKDGLIAAILQAGSGAEAEKELDIGGKLVLPGCIDSHTHFMDPGFTHRETFAHGTRGAAAGGVTTVIDMPCCSVPSVRDVPSLYNKLEKIAPQAYVDFALWGGVTGEDVRNDALDNVQKQADEGVVAYKAYMTPSVPSYPRSSDYELTEICYTAFTMPVSMIFPCSRNPPGRMFWQLSKKLAGRWVFPLSSWAASMAASVRPLNLPALQRYMLFLSAALFTGN